MQAPAAFAAVAFADGQIVSYEASADELRLVFQDWQEQRAALSFHEVAGLEDLGIIGHDLSHGSASTDDPLIERVCAAHDESPAGLWCFTLYSPWNDTPLLRVVARAFRIARPTAEEIPR